MIHIIIKTISLKNGKLPELFRVPLNISFDQPLNSDQYLGMSFTNLFSITQTYFKIIVFIFEIKNLFYRLLLLRSKL